jgi:hypothetical protein
MKQRKGKMKEKSMFLLPERGIVIFICSHIQWGMNT